MPLTPEDVRNKQFSTVRLREGYEMDEVDAFLDEVEAELTRLLRENDDLQARLAAAARQPAPPAEAPPAVAVPAPEPVPAPTPVPMPVPVPPAPAPAPTDSAVRMLELAQRTADEHVAQAKAEADRLVGEARLEAQRVTRDLEKEHAELQAKVDELKVFEREYRTRLRSYLESKLRDLDEMGGRVGVPEPSSVEPPAARPEPPAPVVSAPAAPPVVPAGQSMSGSQPGPVDTSGSARPATPFGPPSAVPSVEPPNAPPVQPDAD